MTRHATFKLALGCLAALAVCGGRSAQAQSGCAPGQNSLIIYHAGSLTAAFTAVERVFTQQTGACITDVAAGSLDATRRVSVGQEPADIFAAADYLDISLLLQPAGLAWRPGRGIVCVPRPERLPGRHDLSACGAALLDARVV